MCHICKQWRQHTYIAMSMLATTFPSHKSLIDVTSSASSKEFNLLMKMIKLEMHMRFAMTNSVWWFVRLESKQRGARDGRWVKCIVYHSITACSSSAMPSSESLPCVSAITLLRSDQSICLYLRICGCRSVRVWVYHLIDLYGWWYRMLARRCVSRRLFSPDLFLAPRISYFVPKRSCPRLLDKEMSCVL